MITRKASDELHCVLGLRDLSDTLSLEAHCRRCDLGRTGLSVSLTGPLPILPVVNLVILAEEPAPAGLEPLEELVVQGQALGPLQEESDLVKFWITSPTAFSVPCAVFCISFTDM